MKMKDEILSLYSEILDLSKKHDECFTSKGSSFAPKLSITEGKDENYWKIREELEDKLSSLSRIIKESMNKIPNDYKKYITEQRIDPSGEIHSIKVYNNTDFSYLFTHYKDILHNLEGDYRSILKKIKWKNIIYGELRGLRGSILSYTKSMDLFVSDIILNIEKQVDLVFKLREVGLEETASSIETLDEVDNKIEKCTIVRNAMEKIVKKYLIKKTGEAKGAFYVPLDKAIENGLTERGQRKAIAGHYTYMSKIIHDEIPQNPNNIQYAINGGLNIVYNLLSRDEVMQTLLD